MAFNCLGLSIISFEIFCKTVFTIAMMSEKVPFLFLSTVGSRNSHNLFFVFDLNKEFPGDSLY